MTAETHRVILALEDGRYLLVAKGLDWPTAITKWQAIDDARLAGNFPGVKYAAVRSDADPDPRWKTAKPIPRWLPIPGNVYKDLGSIGRKVARLYGWTGREGGWLYDANGNVVSQGYASVAGRIVNRRWEAGHLVFEWRGGADGGFVVNQLPKQWLGAL